MVTVPPRFRRESRRPGRGNLPKKVCSLLLLTTLGWIAAGCSRGTEPETAQTPPAATPEATPPAQAAEPASMPATAESVASAAPTTAPPAASPAIAPAAANALDLAWLPPDAELFVHIRVADIWKAPLIESLLAGFPAVQEAAEDLKEKIGLAPGDIESVTFGSSQIAEQLQMGLAGGADLRKLDSDNGIAVFRTIPEVTEETLRLAEHGAEKVEHAGKSYFRIAPPDEEKQMGIYLAGPKVVVVGTENAVKAAIDRGPEAKPQPRHAFLDGSQHVLIALVPADKDKLLAMLPPSDPSAPELVQKADEVLRNHLEGVSLGIKFAKGVDLQVALSSDDAEGATQVKQLADQLVAAGQATFEAQKEGLPPQFAGPAAEIVDSLTAAQNGNTVRMSVNLPESIGPAVAMAMAAAGVMGGPGGTGGEFGIVEGKPVPPVSADGIPEGVNLIARTRWSPFNEVDDEGKELGLLLEILVEATGETARKAVGVSSVDVKTVAAGNDQPLKAQADPFAPEDAASSFTRINREQAFAEHPADGARVVATIATGGKPVEQIAVFEGSFKLRIAKEQKQITVEKALDHVGKELTHDDLKAAGVVLKLARNEEALIVSTRDEDAAKIGGITAVGPDGKPLEVFTTEDIYAEEPAFQLFFEKVPEDVSLRVTLNLETSEIEIPFRFEKIPVPEKPMPIVQPNLPETP